MRLDHVEKFYAVTGSSKFEAALVLSGAFSEEIQKISHG